VTTSFCWWLKDPLNGCFEIVASPPEQYLSSIYNYRTGDMLNVLPIILLIVSNLKTSHTIAEKYAQVGIILVSILPNAVSGIFLFLYILIMLFHILQPGFVMTLIAVCLLRKTFHLPLPGQFQRDAMVCIASPYVVNEFSDLRFTRFNRVWLLSQSHITVNFRFFYFVANSTSISLLATRDETLRRAFSDHRCSEAHLSSSCGVRLKTVWPIFTSLEMSSLRPWSPK
jgi:hypothetical protein